MNLFKKNQFNEKTMDDISELKNKIDNLCDTIGSYQKTKDNFTYNLLTENSTLEKIIAREQTRNEIFKKKITLIEKEFSDFKVSQSNEILNLKKDLAAYKERIKIAANSNGGLKRKTNRQTVLLERQDIYIKLLKKEMKSLGKRVPTMKELLTYEHTRKSPYKNLKEGK